MEQNLFKANKIELYESQRRLNERILIRKVDNINMSVWVFIKNYFDTLPGHLYSCINMYFLYLFFH